ncbi:MAG: LPXTG cell wall anchor domain-containing protein, partial [Staphylococcus rostri]|uniref:LPXTG cell wall anchor domain-containing protein n=1 Tax=Staphylococcus rostri TaxID=522262 RepID=UPI0026DF64D0
SDSDSDSDSDTNNGANNGQDHNSDNDNNAKDHHDNTKALPNTGQESADTAAFGTMFAGLGSLLLFGRKKKRHED